MEFRLECRKESDHIDGRIIIKIIGFSGLRIWINVEFL
jgi:hypothetical protein